MIPQYTSNYFDDQCLTGDIFFDQTLTDSLGKDSVNMGSKEEVTLR